MYKRRFQISLALTIPVLIYSEAVRQWLGFSPPQFRGSEYIPLIFGSIIFFWGGWVFLRSAYSELKSKTPGMMTLIAMAISVAYIYSLATVAGFPGHDLFWELSTLVTIMLLGHWIEMVSIGRAESALLDIAKLLPDKAEKIINGQTETVLVDDLRVGDRVLVKPGSSVPADGTVVNGVSSVNEAAITGESKPSDKAKGDEVIAGTINGEGALTIKVTKIGEDTALAGIMRLISEANASKSRAQALADKAAFVLTIVAITIGVATLIVWLFFSTPDFAITRSVAVLVIACPHALGLAIPLVVSISTSLSAKNGLLVRKRLALESARNLDWVLFDKTGTLTKGEHGVTDIWAVKGHSQAEILRLAASLESNSEHIIGRGIVKYYQEQPASLKKFRLKTVEDFKALPGLGVSGMIGNKRYIAASGKYIAENNLSIPNEINVKSKQAASEGKTEVYLLEGKKVVGAIVLADIIREESREAVAALQQAGIKTAMITGDSRKVADFVAKQLSVDQYFAEVRPQDKAAKVKQLQKGRQKVAMIGDGINDAPALAQADIGVAIGAGTDIAIKSADIILVKNNPMDVIKVINLSRVTFRKMVENLAWATGYNVFAIPLAAGALYFAGIVLAPAVAAILMSISTVIVAANAQLLRKQAI